MKAILNDFLLMIQFFTIIPINKNLECEKKNFRRGAIFLPIVGAILGGVQWGLYKLLILVFPPSIVAIFIIVVSILLTGGLHFDGLGDTCDGFYAFKGKDRIIEIMKDSRIGTYAGLALICDLLFRYAAISFLIEKDLAMILIVAPIIGRFMTIFLCFIGKNAKPTGSGNIFIENMNIGVVGIAFFITEAICIPLVGIEATMILFIGCILLTFLVNSYCNSKIDGLTGDTLGANFEVVEILILLLYIALN